MIVGFRIHVHVLTPVGGRVVVRVHKMKVPRNKLNTTLFYTFPCIWAFRKHKPHDQADPAAYIRE
jgi:hypothetical protein